MIRGTVTISLEEFDNLREKAAKANKLQAEKDLFHEVLRKRMSNVLSEMVDYYAEKKDYSEKPKLNGCEVFVKPDVEGIEKMEIYLDPPNYAGYYKAKIICHY